MLKASDNIEYNELWLEDTGEYVDVVLHYNVQHQHGSFENLSITSVERTDSGDQLVLTSDLSTMLHDWLHDQLAEGSTDLPDMEWTREWE